MQTQRKMAGIDKQFYGHKISIPNEEQRREKLKKYYDYAMKRVEHEKPELIAEILEHAEVALCWGIINSDDKYNGSIMYFDNGFVKRVFVEGIANVVFNEFDRLAEITIIYATLVGSRALKLKRELSLVKFVRFLDTIKEQDYGFVVSDVDTDDLFLELTGRETE